MDSLSFLCKSLFTTQRLTNNGDGTVTAMLNGQKFVVYPAYNIVDQPAGHAADSFWLDSGSVFLRNADKSAQGFRLQ